MRQTGDIIEDLKKQTSTLNRCVIEAEYFRVMSLRRFKLMDQANRNTAKLLKELAATIGVKDAETFND